MQSPPEFVADAFDAAGRKWQGARAYQEDNFEIVSRNGSDGGEWIGVLCDGMGGHAAGDRASRIAVDAAIASLTASPGQAPEKRLVRALEEANRDVRRAVKGDAELKGMGCTFVAVILAAGKLNWISVGDSPMWVIDNQRLIRRNADHSLKSRLAEQVRRGELTEEEAARHPRRNALISAVMGEEIEIYDIGVADFSPGQVLLIASDGVETLSEPEILKTALGGSGAVGMAEAILGAVKERATPKQDNTTIVIALYRDAPALRPAASMARISPKLLIGAGIVVLMLLLLAVFALSGDDEEVKPTGVQVQAPCVLDTVKQEETGGLREACACVAEGREVTWGQELEGETIALFEWCEANGGEWPIPPEVLEQMRSEADAALNEDIATEEPVADEATQKPDEKKPEPVTAPDAE